MLIIQIYGHKQFFQNQRHRLKKELGNPSIQVNLNDNNRHSSLLFL